MPVLVLRERVEDIPVLVQTILGRLSSEMGLPPRTVSPDAMRMLAAYRWPGNVRELINVLERIVNTVDDSVILPCHLPFQIAASPHSPRLNGSSVTLKSIVQQTERQVIHEALRSCRGNRVKAAALLGIPRSALYAKMARYDLR